METDEDKMKAVWDKIEMREAEEAKQSEPALVVERKEPKTSKLITLILDNKLLLVLISVLLFQQYQINELQAEVSEAKGMAEDGYFEPIERAMLQNHDSQINDLLMRVK